jgi:streptogramin lyase
VKAQRWITIGIAAVTLALAVVALTLPGRLDPRPVAVTTASQVDQPPPDVPDPPELNHVTTGVGLLDAASGRTLSFIIPSGALRRPVQAVFADHHFWVFNAAPASFVEIDPTSGAISRRLRSPISDVGFFAVDHDTLWITDESRPLVVALDIRSGRVRHRFTRLPGSGGTAGVVLSHGSLWLARPQAAGGAGILVQLDPRSGRVQFQFTGLTGSYALAVAPDGAIWTAGTYGAVNRVDPVTRQVASTDTPGRNFAIATGGGFGWTVDEISGEISEVSPIGRVVKQYQAGRGAKPLSYADGTLWVGNGLDGTITGVDSQGRVTRYHFDHRVRTLAAGSGVLLVGFAAPINGP